MSNAECTLILTVNSHTHRPHPIVNDDFRLLERERIQVNDIQNINSFEAQRVESTKFHIVKWLLCIYAISKSNCAFNRYFIFSYSILQWTDILAQIVNVKLTACTCMCAYALLSLEYETWPEQKTNAATSYHDWFDDTCHDWLSDWKFCCTHNYCYGETH